MSVELSGASGTPPSGVMTRGSEDEIAVALLDGAWEFVFVALGAIIMLDAGVKAVFVSVPVGLMVAGILVLGITGVGVVMASVVLSLTTGGGVKVGAAVRGGEWLSVGDNDGEIVCEIVPLPVSIGGEIVWLPELTGGEIVWLPELTGGVIVWLPELTGGEKVWLLLSMGGDTVTPPVLIGSEGETVALPVTTGGDTVPLPVSIGGLAVGRIALVITDCADFTSEAIDDATPCAEESAADSEARSELAAVDTACCIELATASTDDAALEAAPRTSLAALLMDARAAGFVVVGGAVVVPLMTVSTPTVNAVVGGCVVAPSTSDATLETWETTALTSEESWLTGPSLAVTEGVASAGVTVGVVTAGFATGLVVTAVVTAVLPPSATALDRVSPTLERTVSRAVVVVFPKGVSTWRLTTRGK